MRILVTDCGSTTTKALLFEKTDDGWRTIARGEAPTTVEAPVADVTVGVENSVRAIEEQTERKIFSTESAAKPFRAVDGTDGVDLYLSTSSAGGGLQMLVLGVVPQFSADSAFQAALRAGAIVREVLTFGTMDSELQQIERLRDERPDIVILAGGTEGGDTHRVIELAELLRAANPKPRFGDTRNLPVLFAGNSAAFPEVKHILTDISEVRIIDNVRPSLDRANINPARDEIHEVFLSHVMSHAPGYAKLLEWTDRPVLPTPSACGVMIEIIADARKQNILCVDIGGATTDIFTCFFGEDGEKLFHRSVSANYGMSYSVGNVLKAAGIEKINRWLSKPLSESVLKNSIKNKMIRPSTIPETIEELALEQAVCREALSLSLVHHNQLAVEQKGKQKRKAIGDIFRQDSDNGSLLARYGVDVVVGSGGVLSHAPERMDAALMMLEGFKLTGVISLAVDSVFMLPHLGVLSTVDPAAAQEVLYADCLVPICSAIIPVLKSKVAPGTVIARLTVNGANAAEIIAGSKSVLKLPGTDKEFEIVVTPAKRNVSVGNGWGGSVRKQMLPAPQGIILDGRQANSMGAQK